MTITPVTIPEPGTGKRKCMVAYDDVFSDISQCVWLHKAYYEIYVDVNFLCISVKLV